MARKNTAPLLAFEKELLRGRQGSYQLFLGDIEVEDNTCVNAILIHHIAKHAGGSKNPLHLTIYEHLTGDVGETGPPGDSDGGILRRDLVDEIVDKFHRSYVLS